MLAQMGPALMTHVACAELSAVYYILFLCMSIQAGVTQIADQRESAAYGHNWTQCTG